MNGAERRPKPKDDQMIIDCTIADLIKGDVASMAPAIYRHPDCEIVRVEHGLPRGGVRITWRRGSGLISRVMPGTNPAIRFSR